RFAPGEIDDFYRDIGFADVHDLGLPVAVPLLPDAGSDPTLDAVGDSALRVTPMHMAIAAAGLSNGGVLSSPFLVMAVNTPQQGWVVLPTGQGKRALPEAQAAQAVRLLALPDLPAWQSLGTAQTEGHPLTWYLAGTLPEWQGSPLAVVVILEERDPALAQKIGRSILEETLLP
ncbi:MAG: hypothetical protein GYA17_16930, partial [Chloroflexi bacterium]|nr:hypothetical protein [Chloroflexota bacterium]